MPLTRMSSAVASSNVLSPDSKPSSATITITASFERLRIVSTVSRS